MSRLMLRLNLMGLYEGCLQILDMAWWGEVP